MPITRDEAKEAIESRFKGAILDKVELLENNGYRLIFKHVLSEETEGILTFEPRLSLTLSDLSNATSQSYIRTIVTGFDEGKNAKDKS